jgi:hypothetical protein
MRQTQQPQGQQHAGYQPQPQQQQQQLNSLPHSQGQPNPNYDPHYQPYQQHTPPSSYPAVPQQHSPHSQTHLIPQQPAPQQVPYPNYQQAAPSANYANAVPPVTAPMLEPIPPIPFAPPAIGSALKNSIDALVPYLLQHPNQEPVLKAQVDPSGHGFAYNFLHENDPAFEYFKWRSYFKRKGHADEELEARVVEYFQSPPPQQQMLLQPLPHSPPTRHTHSSHIQPQPTAPMQQPPLHVQQSPQMPPLQVPLVPSDLSLGEEQEFIRLLRSLDGTKETVKGGRRWILSRASKSQSRSSRVLQLLKFHVDSLSISQSHRSDEEVFKMKLYAFYLLNDVLLAINKELQSKKAGVSSADAVSSEPFVAALTPLLHEVLIPSFVTGSCNEDEEKLTRVLSMWEDKQLLPPKEVTAAKQELQRQNAALRPVAPPVAPVPSVPPAVPPTLATDVVHLPAAYIVELAREANNSTAAATGKPVTYAPIDAARVPVKTPPERLARTGRESGHIQEKLADFDRDRAQLNARAARRARRSASLSTSPSPKRRGSTRRRSPSPPPQPRGFHPPSGRRRRSRSASRSRSTSRDRGTHRHSSSRRDASRSRSRDRSPPPRGHSRRSRSRSRSRDRRGRSRSRSRSRERKPPSRGGNWDKGAMGIPSYGGSRRSRSRSPERRRR